MHDEVDSEMLAGQRDDPYDESLLDDSLVSPEDGEEELEEPDFSTVATGATVEAAKRNAVTQLRKIVPWVNEDHIDFVVIDEGARGGLFGRGRTQPQVEARVRPSVEPADADLPPAARDLDEFLTGLVTRMGLEATVEVHDDGDSVSADMAGPDLGILIGRHGQTIDAVQYVAAIAVNRRRDRRRRVVVDAEGYRERREASLHAVADRAAQRVARDREAIVLKPMSAAERKVVHLRLKDHPKVQTASEGQEPNRSVVVSPRG